MDGNSDRPLLLVRIVVEMTYQPPPPPPPPPPPAYPGQPAYAGQPGQPGQPPNNQFVWSILCTVMCWMPLGIVAIINSSKGCMDG